jgi:integrase
MATFKIWVLRNNMKRDGSMPVTVQLTHRGQRRYVRTPHAVFAPQLDRSGNIKDPNVKLITDGIYRRVKDAIDALSFRVDAYTPDELKEHVAGKLSGADAQEAVDFFRFSEEYVARIAAEQPGTARNQRSMLGNLERYVGGRRLSCSELTSRFLHKYHQWMAAEGGAGGGPLGERGQSLYLGCLRALLNAAQREYNDYEKGDVPIPNRPFERFKVPQARSIKTAEQKALSLAQLRAIRGYAPVGRPDELARDVFMLSFYLCGMNSVDLYQCSELLDGGVVRYHRAKVAGRRGDRAEMRVRVEPEALPLLEKYRDRSGERVFCFHRTHANARAFSKALNGSARGGRATGLKAVGKAAGVDDLSFYYARHSWATVAANVCGIPVDTVEDCLAHSDSRLAKKYYIQKDWERVYSANRAVLDALWRGA